MIQCEKCNSKDQEIAYLKKRLEFLEDIFKKLLEDLKHKEIIYRSLT